MDLSWFLAALAVLVLAAWIGSIYRRLSSAWKECGEAWEDWILLRSSQKELEGRLESLGGDREGGEPAGRVEVEELREEILHARRRLPYARQRYNNTATRYNEAIRALTARPVALLCRFPARETLASE